MVVTPLRRPDKTMNPSRNPARPLALSSRASVSSRRSTSRSGFSITDLLVVRAEVCRARRTARFVSNPFRASGKFQQKRAGQTY